MRLKSDIVDIKINKIPIPIKILDRTTVTLGKIFNLFGLFKSAIDNTNDKMGTKITQYVDTLLRNNLCSSENCIIPNLNVNIIIYGTIIETKITNAAIPSFECLIPKILLHSELASIKLSPLSKNYHL